MPFDADRLREIAERVAASSGLEVVEIEHLGGGKHRMLRVFLDKPVPAGWTAASGTVPPGVTHEDCASFSREFGTIIEVEDAAPSGAYTLEVSSPGLDRKLVRPADFERFTGSKVKLQTFQPVNGNRHYEGRLQAVREGRLTLDLTVARKKSRPQADQPQTVDIELANVEKANLVPEI